MTGARNPIDAFRHWLAARRFAQAFAMHFADERKASARRCTQDIHHAREAKRHAVHEALAGGRS